MKCSQGIAKCFSFGPTLYRAVLFGSLAASLLSAHATGATPPVDFPQQEEIAAMRLRYGLDQPWDDLQNAPPVIRRQRGLVAAALQWFEFRGAPHKQPVWLTESNATAIIQAARHDEDLLSQKRDEFWCAYFSRADASGQPFILRAPHTVDPRKTYPLIVILHGLGQRPRHNDFVPVTNAFFEVRPWGRGDAAYVALGERDVLDIIAYMREWYPIDSTRILLTGSSMGGRGSWTLASRHPQLFAAAAPISGWADNLPFYNLANLPIFVQHGDADLIVSVACARWAVADLTVRGYPPLYREYPNLGHGIVLPCLVPAKAWLLEQPPRSFIKPFRMECQIPEESDLGWLKALRTDNPHCLLRLETEIKSDGNLPPQILVTLSNITAIEIRRSLLPFPRQTPIAIRINGQTSLNLPDRDRIIFARETAAWDIADRWTETASSLRPYRPGAAANLFTGEPLMVVYGQGGGWRRTRLLQETADFISRYPGYGRPMTEGGFPVFSDRDFFPQDLARYNLILIGSPRDNRLIRRMIPELPISFDEQERLIAGAHRPVALERCGVLFFHPNPLAPQRWIYLIIPPALNSDAKVWMKDPEELLPGSDGLDRCNQADLIVESVADGLRCRMQFTHDWKWNATPGFDQPVSPVLAVPETWQQARLRFMLSSSDAAMALDLPVKSRFDPNYATLSDINIDSRTIQTLIGELNGRELQTIVDSGKVILSRPPPPADSQEPVRVIMPVYLYWRLNNFLGIVPRSIQSGPLIPYDVIRPLALESSLNPKH